MDIKQMLLQEFQKFNELLALQNAQQIMDNDMSWDETFDEAGFNSFFFIKFMIDLEEQLGVKFNDEMYLYEGSETINDFYQKLCDYYDKNQS